jgi:hypothetical protein
MTLSTEDKKKLELYKHELEVAETEAERKRIVADIKAAKARISHSRKTHTKGVIRFRPGVFRRRETI